MQTRQADKNEALLRLRKVRGYLRPSLCVGRQLCWGEEQTYFLPLRSDQSSSDCQCILHAGGRNVEARLKGDLSNILPVFLGHSDRRPGFSLRDAYLYDDG